MSKYTLVNKNPVARFFYKGPRHTHPVRRTILVIEEDNTKLTGYEVREGNLTRETRKAPVKSFLKERIANYGDYNRLKMTAKTYMKLDSESTLERANLEDFVLNGA